MTAALCFVLLRISMFAQHCVLCLAGTVAGASAVNARNGWLALAGNWLGGGNWWVDCWLNNQQNILRASWHGIQQLSFLLQNGQRILISLLPLAVALFFFLVFRSLARFFFSIRSVDPFQLSTQCFFFVSFSAFSHTLFWLCDTGAPLHGVLMCMRSNEKNKIKTYTCVFWWFQRSIEFSGL